MRRFTSIVAAFLIAAAGAALGVAQGNQTFTQRWYFASDFGQWRVPGQQANTYQWSPGTLCYVAAAGNAQSFFPFNTNAPIEIVDATAANTEVATPSAVTQNASSCSLTVSPQNSHYSFSMASGTGGLQEALNNIGTGSPGTVVWLDRNWYSLIGSIPGVTPAGVIAAATGAANVMLVDDTQTPWVTYVWNGSTYVLAASRSGLPSLVASSYTAISAPSALSTSASTYGLITTGTSGGTIPASSTYRLAATYVDASGGETLISTDSASTATIATGTGSANTISVTSPAAATGAVGWRLYMTAASGASGAEILYTPTCSPAVTGLPTQSVLASVCPIGSTATISAIVTGTAKIPVAAGAFPRLAIQTGNLPAFAALSTVASTTTGTLGVLNLPAGYLNSLGKSLTICGDAYATNNGTAGTLTFATKLASLVGTTSITPFTSTSGTTTASAQIPINFCETWTTISIGSSGTLEAHGRVIYGLSGAAGGEATSLDYIFAASSGIDLTKQDQIQFTITPATAGLTAAQLRQVSLTPIF